MSGIEDIYDEAPTEPEAGQAEETPAEETPAEGTETPAKSDVIDELVEGKTPEAKEKTEAEPPPESTEQELAEAALKETEPPLPKGAVPLPKFMAEKKDHQKTKDLLEEETAKRLRAEGAVEALKKPAEKKPMSVQDMIEAGRIEADDAVPAGIWAEIEANKAEAAQATTEPTSNRDAFLEKAAKSEETMIAETTVEKVGEGLTYEAVVSAGKDNLSVRDHAKIVRSDDPCRTLYDLCIKRTPELKKAGAVVEKEEGTKPAPKKKKEPKNAPIPKGTAEEQAASADAEVEFMEAEMAKPEDQQLQEIRELTNAPSG